MSASCGICTSRNKLVDRGTEHVKILHSLRNDTELLNRLRPPSGFGSRRVAQVGKWRIQFFGQEQA
jgi:hypothetical protein